MKPWILYAGMTVVAWGVWGVFSKLASNYTRPRQTLLFQVVGVMAFGLVVLSMERFHIDWSPPGFAWSAGAGFVGFDGDRDVVALPGGHHRTECSLSA
jgi:transporter family protein